MLPSTTHGGPATGPLPQRPLPWRKRHPVKARLLLYGVLLAVLTIPAVLWVRARRSYLEARIESLTLLVQLDPSGASLREGLAAEFSEWGPLPNPALNDVLRQRAERLRGVAASLGKDREAMEAAFGRAEALGDAATGGGAGIALRLERAHCRLALQDVPGALRDLAGVGASGSPVLEIWRRLLAARAAGTTDQAPARRADLEAHLSALPAPLPRRDPEWFMLRPWTGAEAALEATRWLAAALAPELPRVRALWARLVAQAGPEAGVLLEAAEALVVSGDLPGARQAYQKANEADPSLAQAQRALRPALRGLDAR